MEAAKVDDTWPIAGGIPKKDERSMELAKLSPRQLMQEIHGLEKGIPAKMISTYVKCVENGLVENTCETASKDRGVLEAYARTLIHEGIRAGWIFSRERNWRLAAELARLPAAP
jgi:hypothetical protein